MKKKGKREVLIVCGLIMLILSLSNMKCFYLSPEAALEDYLKDKSKTSVQSIEHKGVKCAEYFCEVNDGVVLVRVKKNRWIWNFVLGKGLGFGDGADDHKVYDLSSHDFDEKVTRVYGLCKNNSMVKVKVLEELTGKETSYDVENNLFCVDIDDSVTGDVRIYGVDDKNKELWRLEYIF